MAISDAQYNKWLLDDNRRVILVEMDYWDLTTSTEKTEYMSYGGFVSKPSDTPSNIPYNDIVSKIPDFEISVTVPNPLEGNFEIVGSSSWGDIVVDNQNGERDTWIQQTGVGGRIWTGRKIRLLRGDPTWSYVDFREISVLYCVSIEASYNEITFKVKGMDYLLEDKIQKDTITTGESKDKPLPIAYGEVFNTEPVLINTISRIYKWNDGVVNSVTDIRDRGVTVAYTLDNPNGEFTLTIPAQAKITLDGTGGKLSGIYIYKPADIIEHILLNRTTMTSAQIDSTSFSNFNTTCPQTIGLYLSQEREEDVKSVINLILTSVGSFFYFSRDGKIELERFEIPSVTEDFTIDVDDIFERKLEPKETIEPVYEISLNYKRNWSPSEKDSMAGAVVEPNLTRYSQEYQSVKATDASILTAFPNSKKADAIDTLLVDQTETQNECTRLLAIHKIPRNVYTISLKLPNPDIKINQTVKVIYPRYGFDNGVNCRIIGIVENITSNTITLDVWK